MNEIEEKINNFNRTIKVPFLEEVLKELDLAYTLDDPVFLAFDTFNVSSDFDLEKREQCVNVLSTFYGKTKSSTFNNETNTVEPIINKLGLSQDEIKSFFSDFNAEVRQEEDKRNEEIRKFIENKKLQPGKVSQYKEDHPIAPSDIYKTLMKEQSEYPELMILFKACVRYFSLFIKDKCISSLFRTKYIEKKFNLQLFFFPLFHEDLLSPGLPRATHLLKLLA